MKNLPHSPEEISFFLIPSEAYLGKFRGNDQCLGAEYLRELNLQSVSVSQNGEGWWGGREVSFVCLRLYEERGVLSVSI